MYRGSTHYLGDKQDFDVSSEGLSSGISEASLWGKTCVLEVVVLKFIILSSYTIVQYIF